ncbi:MAG: hypothetical protein M0R06_27045 [Sphaerochaeta sp.]|jgi:hypothetical protein|nr:hypothetical protein [Sphaerochaeta sp.]
MDGLRVGIRKAGNAGMVTTTGGNDLVHTLAITTIAQQTFPARSFVIRKIMWYNNTGANATLSFGTLNGTPAFVALLPTILAINTFDGELGERDLPEVEFISTPTVGVLAANQRNGNAYVLCSAVGVLVSVEIEEFGA